MFQYIYITFCFNMLSSSNMYIFGVFVLQNHPAQNICLNSTLSITNVLHFIPDFFFHSLYPPIFFAVFSNSLIPCDLSSCINLSIDLTLRHAPLLFIYMKLLHTFSYSIYSILNYFILYKNVRKNEQHI